MIKQDLDGLIPREHVTEETLKAAAGLVDVLHDLERSCEEIRNLRIRVQDAELALANHKNRLEEQLAFANQRGEEAEEWLLELKKLLVNKRKEKSKKTVNEEVAETQLGREA